jgi:hypothetical protein
MEAKMKSEALAPKGITNATVQCPAETEVKVGATVECSVTADGKKGKVTARFADDKGGLTDYQPDVNKILIANLEKNIEEQESNVSGVACPSNIKPKAGGRYVCFGTIKGSGLGKIAVTQTSEDGNVTVQAQKRKLTTGKIESNIRKAVQKQVPGATVNCPANVTSQKGSVFRCTVRNPANGKQITIAATQKDSAGNFDLKVEK